MPARCVRLTLRLVLRLRRLGGAARDFDLALGAKGGAADPPRGADPARVADPARGAAPGPGVRERRRGERVARAGMAAARRFKRLGAC